jgi:hypothetical protein
MMLQTGKHHCHSPIDVLIFPSIHSSIYPSATTSLLIPSPTWLQVPAASLQAWQKTFHNLARVRAINTASKRLSVAEGGNDKGFGYKYMCKFFSVDIYDYLQEYDFYFRLGR